eukprot:3940677-Rhodomonas_salina.7
MSGRSAYARARYCLWAVGLRGVWSVYEETARECGVAEGGGVGAATELLRVAFPTVLRIAYALSGTDVRGCVAPGYGRTALLQRAPGTTACNAYLHADMRVGGGTEGEY